MPIDQLSIAQAALIAGAIAHHEQVPIARRDIGVACQNGLTVIRHAHVERRIRVHADGERAAEGLRDVLGNDHSRNIRGQMCEHFFDRFGPAG